MFIYQIGDVILRGITTYSTPASWRGEAIQNLANSQVFFNNAYMMPEPANISVSGSIWEYNTEPAYKQLQRLFRIGGRPYTDIIGYEVDECNNVSWYHTYGFVRSIDRTYDIDTNIPNESLEVSLELEANPFWTPLNKYNWFAYYGDDLLQPFDLIESSSIVSYTVPSQEELVGDTNRLSHPDNIVPFHSAPEFKFYKRTYSDKYKLYNPIYWEEYSKYIHQQSPTNNVSLATYYVTALGSGDIKSLHAFRNLTTTGTINIDVDSEYSSNNIITHSSTISLTQLLINLIDKTTYNGNNFTGFNANTTLYCGIELYPISFVMHEGYPLIDNTTGNLAIPYWTYEFRAPGDLIGIRNKITYTMHPQIEFSYLHTSRMV